MRCVVLERKVVRACSRWVPREGGGVMFCKKSGLSEVADTECIFSPEDVEIVSVLVSENNGVADMDNGSFPDRDTIHEKRGGERRTGEEREEAEAEDQH